ncbi:MAG: hypothetical protein AAF170_07060 [Bacteroidota bacterium]
MSRSFVLLLGLALSACASTRSEAPTRLAEGTWTGTLTPMNHPDQNTPMRYRVAYLEEDLSIEMDWPGGDALPARDAELQEGMLTFGLIEPEGNASLQCNLARQPDGSFDGRCADAEGKWARFTMLPPVE